MADDPDARPGRPLLSPEAARAVRATAMRAAEIAERFARPASSKTPRKGSSRPGSENTSKPLGLKTGDAKVIDPSGLTIITRAREDWPPKDKQQERDHVRRHLNGFYDLLRTANAGAVKRGTERAQKRAVEVSSQRTLRLVIGGIFVAMYLLSLLDRTGNGWPFMLVVGAGFVISAFLADAGASVLDQRDVPPAAELNKLYDRLLAEDVERHWQNAGTALGLQRLGPAERQPVGPAYNFPDLTECGDAVVGRRRGEDDVVRFTPRSLYFLSFHANQIVAYDGAFDLIKGESIYHKVREFSYQDVVTISRTQRRQTLMCLRDDEEFRASGDDDKKRQREIVAQTDTLQIGLVSGMVVPFVLNDTYLADSRDGADQLVSTNDYVVELIRALVRDKKQYTLGQGLGHRP